MPWLIVILGYLLGSIPTAYIVGRVLKGVDIREIGDGNMGSANTFRQIGPKAGITVGAIDAAKGALAVFIAQLAGLSLTLVLITGTAVVVGHNWPVFLGFRGGRGEATTIGVLLVVITKPMLIMAAPTIAAQFIFRDTTKSGAVLFIPLSLVCWLTGASVALIAYSIALPCLVGLTHFLRTRRVAETSGTGRA
jgi:glycerol-3-phosphate acyltransferase PlsY